MSMITLHTITTWGRPIWKYIYMLQICIECFYYNAKNSYFIPSFLHIPKSLILFPHSLIDIMIHITKLYYLACLTSIQHFVHHHIVTSLTFTPVFVILNYGWNTNVENDGWLISWLSMLGPYITSIVPYYC